MLKKTTPNPDKWLDEHGDYLFRYAMFRLNNQTLAEDLVQDTFLSALRAHANFEGKSSERTWLLSILKNKIIDHYRKASRQGKQVDLVGRDEDSEDFEENGFWKLERAPSDWGHTPEMALEKKEFYEILKKCLALLPDKISQAFTFRQIDGMTSENVCKELGISSSNLWVMLHRARSKLRRCLDVNWFGLEGE